MDTSWELLAGILPSFGNRLSEHGANTEENKAKRQSEAVCDVLILRLWTSYPSSTARLYGHMNQYISFAVVFGDGGGGGSLVGYILSWGPITWNQKKPWEEWGQWEYRAQGRTIIEEMTQEDEPKKKARGKSNPGKYSTR